MLSNDFFFLLLCLAPSQLLRYNGVAPGTLEQLINTSNEVMCHQRQQLTERTENAFHFPTFINAIAYKL